MWQVIFMFMLISGEQMRRMFTVDTLEGVDLHQLQGELAKQMENEEGVPLDPYIPLGDVRVVPIGYDEDDDVQSRIGRLDSPELCRTPDAVQAGLVARWDDEATGVVVLRDSKGQEYRVLKARDEASVPVADPNPVLRARDYVDSLVRGHTPAVQTWILEHIDVWMDTMGGNQVEEPEEETEEQVEEELDLFADGEDESKELVGKAKFDLVFSSNKEEKVFAAYQEAVGRRPSWYRSYLLGLVQVGFFDGKKALLWKATNLTDRPVSKEMLSWLSARVHLTNHQRKELVDGLSRRTLDGIIALLRAKSALRRHAGKVEGVLAKSLKPFEKLADPAATSAIWEAFRVREFLRKQEREAAMLAADKSYE